MNKIKVLIDNKKINDDFLGDIKKVISLSIEEIIQDSIDNLEMEVLRDIDNIVELNINQVVEVFTQGDIRRFYGFITDIQPSGGLIKIKAEAEPRNLLRKLINRNFRSDGETEGKTHLIVKELIEFSDLTAEVEDSGRIIDEFKCIHASPFSRILELMRSDNYQLRYDHHLRVLHYEPRGFDDTGLTLETQMEIIGLPKWDTNTDGMINDLRIDGATSESQLTEVGTIGTTDRFTTEFIELSEKPSIVELIINGIQQKGGTKDASIDYDYYIDFEEQKLIPKTSFPIENAIVNYSWLAPIPVRRTRFFSINKYGLKQENFRFSDITSIQDAVKRAENILNTRSEPFIVGQLLVRTDLISFKVGDLVTIVDNISRPNVNKKLVISKILRKYPSSIDEIIVGDKEWRLEDDLIEMDERIKRLEERFIRERDFINEQREVDNIVKFIKPRFIKINKGDYSVDRNIGIYNNTSHGKYNIGKKYASKGETAFDYAPHFIRHRNNVYKENFRHKEFLDITTADWNTKTQLLTLENGTSLTTSSISFNDFEIGSAICLIELAEGSESLEGLDISMTADGINYQSFEEGNLGNFTNTGTDLRLKLETNPLADFTEGSIIIKSIQIQFLEFES